MNEMLLGEKTKFSRQPLKDNLIEHYDFEKLHPIVWKHLYSWYSADI